MYEFSIRDELESIIMVLNIDSEKFHKAGKTQWFVILQKTEESFLKKQHYTNSLHLGWSIGVSITNNMGVRLHEPWYRRDFNCE